MTQTTVTPSDTDRRQTPTYTGSHIDLQLPTVSLTHNQSHTDIHPYTNSSPQECRHAHAQLA